MPEFIENSVACVLLRRAYSGSRVVKLIRSFYRGAARVVDGSRVIGLFRVTDYLDIDRSPVWSMCWDSRTLHFLTASAGRARDLAGRIWTTLFRQEGKSHALRALRAFALRVRDPAGRLRESFSRKGSILSWVLDRVYFFLQPGFSLRGRLILVLAFLVGFYASRQIAMILVPGANLLSPWSAGLCIALLLIWVLYQPNDRHHGQGEQVAKARGLLQWLWLALCWFPCKIAPVARHLKVVCRKIVFGAAPPIEGGDV